MAAAREMQNRWLQQTFRNMIRQRGGRNASDQLPSHFDVVRMLTEEDGFQGCIFVNAAIEFPLPHDPVHRLSADSKQAIIDITHQIAELAGADSPERVAQELCMIIDAPCVGRVVTGRSDIIDTARRMAEGVIRAHLKS